MPQSYRNVLSPIQKKAKRLIHKIQGRQFLHFLHIGKTGGSAIKYGLKPFLINERAEIYLRPHRITLRAVPKGQGVIFFLRDPITRFTSGFYSRKRQDKPRYYFPWSENEKIAFEYFETPNDLGLALSSKDEEEKARAEKAMKSIGHVKSSYWDWFESEEYYLSRLADIFFVGFQESLTEDWEKLRLKLGLPDSAQLPEDDIQAHRNPQHFDRSLQKEAVENLKSWYQDDYKFIKLVYLFHPESQSSRSKDSRRAQRRGILRRVQAILEQ